MAAMWIANIMMEQHPFLTVHSPFELVYRETGSPPFPSFFDPSHANNTSCQRSPSHKHGEGSYGLVDDVGGNAPPLYARNAGGLILATALGMILASFGIIAQFRRIYTNFSRAFLVPTHPARFRHSDTSFYVAYRHARTSRPILLTKDHWLFWIRIQKTGWQTFNTIMSQVNKGYSRRR